MSASISPAATLPAVIDDIADRTPDAPFLVTDETTWTYADVRDTADRLARSLHTIGVGPGDRVAIAAPNGPEWILALIATGRIGATLVALNIQYREHELDFMLNESGASVFICASEHRGFDFVGFLEGFRSRLPGVKHFVFLGHNGFDGSRSWAHLLESAPSTARQWEPVSTLATAVLLYTSGTTGAPKGAMLTHGSILASARAQAVHLEQAADDAVIAHMPFNHVGGLTCTVIAAAVVGARLIVVPGFHPQQSLQAIIDHRATLCVGVPTMFSLMLGEPAFADADLSAIRLCVVGGSNLDPALGRRVADAFPGARLANLYGLSETSGGAVISAADDDLDTLVETLGVPIGDTRVRVVDDEDADVEDGVDGELLVGGACLADGYWQRPDSTELAFGDDGWLRTGDMATLRADGHVVMRGRKKEMYVRGGYNVYPAEIENVLATAPGVVMVAVIGVPDATYGEVGWAIVVGDEELDLSRLHARCREQLARYKQPERIVVVESLPLTPSGKIQKAALQAMYGSTANS
ncbi:acyl--CoA ligase [Gordonia desulfuricans]|uniref:Acyl--CoA ligase n=1 Tax=Gordonia desulfuricans TaxID=89051 RepID=A0A7K3LNW1_9ACTN|nr:class I adenylate-forming enzyme family protein [Gordonia desulfuricans]NDK89721.1 acyl--CoA ligase [Gordonia desulfuricans]